MAIEREELLREGMEVVGSDGGHVGKVKECRSTDFLVDRRLKRDVYVPLDAIQEITGDCVTLSVPHDVINNMPWARPSL